MRLFEIESQSELNEVGAVLKRDCSMYLNAVGDFMYALFVNPLWRGIPYRTSKIYRMDEKLLNQVSSKENRIPKDMPLAAHVALDAMFFRQFGIRYRSNAFFTTGSMTIANGYGEPCVFIPIGDFNFCWSDEIVDLYTAVSFLVNEEKRGNDNPDITELFEAAAEDVYYAAKYQNTNLLGAIAAGHEIMVHCKSAYLITDQSYHKLLMEYNAQNG